ncbi:hypothetical protein MCEMAEM6B_00311 [Mycobacteriaceae bacterium]
MIAILWQQPFRVVEIIRSAAQREVWRWYPFGSAIFAFSGAPAAGLDQRVFCFAGEGELVDIGVAAVGPLIDVVDFGVVSGDIATRRGTAAFKGVQDEPLVTGRDAFGPA